MTFGAMTAWQAGLLIAAAGALAVWLFLIKLRPPRIPVPSLLLWRRVLDESRELTLWERIRRTVSLVLTLLVALVLALAVVRPSRGGGGTAAAAPGRLLIVIDSSWSMLARTAGGATRWDRAKAEARRLAAAGDEVALATTADGLVEGPTSDAALIETTLDRLTPAGGEATAWPSVGGSTAVHFITDGAVARPLDAGMIVHTVFEPAANVAVTAFEVRPSLAADQAGEAYLEIANYAPSPQTVHVTLTRGTTALVDRQLAIGAGEAVHQVTPLARGADARLRATVSAPENALAIDDEAFAWIEHARPLAVTVVGQRTGWLAALLGRDPDLRATFVDPSKYQPGTESDKDETVLVFDRWAPEQPPARPALYFAPPVTTGWLNGGSAETGSSGADSAAEEKRPRWEQAGSHPVVRGVDPLTLKIERARPYRSPSLVAIARSTTGTPLVYVGDSPERRLVVVTFGPAESNLTAAPGFPVLVGNALEWLARPVPYIARKPGLASFDNSIARVIGPGGAPIPLARLNGAAVGVLPVPGLYVAESGGARSTIAVNAGDPQVSNLTHTSVGPAAHALTVSAGGASRPWWLYCAAAAFLLVLAEWWTWQRRITV
jgi:hypothetical protein